MSLWYIFAKQKQVTEMSNFISNKYNQDLESLREVMKKYPGSLVRTAQKIDCSTTWIYRILTGRVAASEEATNKVVAAALDVIKEMKEEKERQEMRRHEALQNRSMSIQKTLSQIGELATAI